MAWALSTLLPCRRATSQTGACRASAAGRVKMQRPPSLLNASVVSAVHRRVPVELKAMFTAHNEDPLGEALAEPTSLPDAFATSSRYFVDLLSHTATVACGSSVAPRVRAFSVAQPIWGME